MQMRNGKPETLLEIARELASGIVDFQAPQGAGKGDHATNNFMRALRARAVNTFGEDFSEQSICGKNLFKVDFYFRNERAIVEVALGLPNPSSEFEKDILKAIMAQELGFPVRRLFFISRPGATKKCGQPGRRAIREWALKRHRLAIEVHELRGEPRRRRRRRGAAPEQ